MLQVSGYLRRTVIPIVDSLRDLRVHPCTVVCLHPIYNDESPGPFVRARRGNSSILLGVLFSGKQRPAAASPATMKE